MILVTGGTGFIGRHLVNRLAADGERVRVLSRTTPATLPEGVECVAGDLAGPGSLEPALAGVCRVVHLAALVPATRSAAADLERVNREGTARLARAAAEAGVRQLVHVSSAGVYGDRAGTAAAKEDDPPQPGTAYQRSKLAAEEALARTLLGSGVRWIILRPTLVYGPGSAALFRDVARRRLWLHGPAPGIVQPTFVADVVAVVAAALARDDVADRVFNVGGERALDYRELIAAVASRIGRAPIQLTAPGWAERLAAAVGGLWRASGREPPQRVARLAHAAVNWSVDTTRVRSVLGYEPTPLAEGLDRTAAWFVRGAGTDTSEAGGRT